MSCKLERLEISTGEQRQMETFYRGPARLGLDMVNWRSRIFGLECKGGAP
jgi:hypothetical protein